MDKALVSKFLLPATHRITLKDDRFKPEFLRGETIFMKRLDDFSRISYQGLYVLRLKDGGITIRRVAMHEKVKGALKLYHHGQGSHCTVLSATLVADIYAVMAKFEKGVDFSRYAGLVEHVTPI